MSHNPPSSLLFLCTGNYYRSRFAEQLFNHRATMRSLPWTATSRGLAIELLDRDAGLISPHTIKGLTRLGIPMADPIAVPRQVSNDDLRGHDRIIALKETEHRPLMRERFPAWEHHVEYWHVDDIDVARPDDALPQLENLVDCLIKRLEAAA
jgi:protein-tyrosine phosphatase